MTTINWQKMNGLVPAIIQNSLDQKFLMLGYMNKEALNATKATGHVTFYSRSKQRLWTKGESSGNFLNVDRLDADCDQDSILIQATPQGPTCHTGQQSCFEEKSSFGRIESIVKNRISSNTHNSYTSQLVNSGIDRVAQKVGEEAIELVIAAKNPDRKATISECADLIFHTSILLQMKGISWGDIDLELMKREKKTTDS